MKKEFSEQDLTKLQVLFQFLDYMIKIDPRDMSKPLLVENRTEKIMNAIDELIEL